MAAKKRSGSQKGAHSSPSKRKPVKPSKPKSVPRPTPKRGARTLPTAGPGSIAEGSVEHVVIILEENHTFDCYFGAFPGANGDATLMHATDPPTGTFRNNHAAWLSRGTMAVREQYQKADIAQYWAYAQQFTLCDNFYSDVASDSTPNDLMLIAADSPAMNNPSSGSAPLL